MHSRQAGRRRAITLIEVLVLVSLILIIAAIVIATLPNIRGGRRGAPQVRDATQLTQIHKGMITMARFYDGRLPTPGIIDTIGSEQGIGAEDHSANNTANMYSSIIAQDYITTPILYCPTEPNGNVVVKSDYDYDMYRPVDDIYWDPSFKVDLSNEAHSSYAHSQIGGHIGQQHWNDSVDSEWVILGNRGPENGSTDPDIYDNSLTLKIHRPHDTWVGNLCFADNHVELHNSFFIQGINYTTAGGKAQPDNIFRNDADNDIWLTIHREVDEGGVIKADSVQWD